MPAITCNDCGADLTGTNDGTGLPYCHDCGEAKDDEHVALPVKDGRTMTAQELQELEQKCRDSRAFYDADRAARNEAVRAALSTGWTQTEIAETTGLTRGRIHQIVKGDTR